MYGSTANVLIAGFVASPARTSRLCKVDWLPKVLGGLGVASSRITGLLTDRQANSKA